MAIEFNKPQPLMVGDKAYYALTSYDPVEITVEVPFTTDEDVEFALDTMLARMGATRANLQDGNWLEQHFQGIPDLNALRAAVRAQVADMNAQVAEEQKLGLATAELAKRLKQSVPAAHVARYRESIMLNFEQQLASEGMSVEQFLSRSAATRADLERMFDQQAEQVAEQDAALDAYAREKKLTVDESEFSGLLGVPAAEFEDVISQARAAGRYDDLRDAALRAKAARAVVAESACSYHHESEAEAHERVEQVRRMRAQFEGRGGADGTPGASASGLHLV